MKFREEQGGGGRETDGAEKGEGWISGQFSDQQCTAVHTHPWVEAGSSGIIDTARNLQLMIFIFSTHTLPLADTVARQR